MAPSKNREQARIDDTIATLTGGVLPLRRGLAPSGGLTSLPLQLARDLHNLSLLLERLGMKLAGEKTILRTYGSKLQLFDIAAQTLDVASKFLSGQSGTDLAQRLQSLRASRGELGDGESEDRKRLLTRK